MSCQNCGGNAHNAYLCHHCTNQLRTMLLDLVTGPENHGHPSQGLIADLQDAATGHTRFTDPAPATTTSAPDSRTPRVNPAASNLLSQLHTQLARIAASLPISSTNTRPPDRTPSSEQLAAWLATHAKTMANHISAEQTYLQIHAMTHRILRAIDRPAPTRYAGPCDCGTRLQAPLDAREVACPMCGIIHDIDARQHELLAELVRNGGTFTRIELPLVMSMLGLSCSARTLQHWRRTNQLPIAGYNDENEPLYRPADLLTRPTENKRAGCDVC